MYIYICDLSFLHTNFLSILEMILIYIIELQNVNSFFIYSNSMKTTIVLLFINHFLLVCGKVRLYNE